MASPSRSADHPHPFSTPAAPGRRHLTDRQPGHTLSLADGTRIDASLVSAGNPMVFVSAHALGVICTASQATLNANTRPAWRCEQLRIAGVCYAMATADSAEDRNRHQHAKLAIAPPAACQSVDSQALRRQRSRPAHPRAVVVGFHPPSGTAAALPA